MKTTAPNQASGDHKKIIMIILIIIAVVAIIAALIFNLTGKNKNTVKDTSKTSSEAGSDLQTKEASDSSTRSETKETGSEDIQPQIEALILKYRTAFASGDIEALKDVYNTNDVMNSDVITATAKIITGYENTACYMKDGTDSTSKVVFIYDDLKIDGIDTRIPNISYVYVKQKDDGSYYIYPGEYDKTTSNYVYSSDIQIYISELIKDKEINALYASVNEKITKAMNDDPKVKAFVQKLTANDQELTDAASQTEDKAQAESDATQQTDSAAETNTEPDSATESDSVTPES